LSSGGGPDGAGSGANEGAGEAASAGSRPVAGEEPSVPWPGVPNVGDAEGAGGSGATVAEREGLGVAGGGSWDGREHALPAAARQNMRRSEGIKRMGSGQCKRGAMAGLVSGLHLKGPGAERGVAWVLLRAGDSIRYLTGGSS
jgi:hypothetical protein